MQAIDTNPPPHQYNNDSFHNHYYSEQSQYQNSEIEVPNTEERLMSPEMVAERILGKPNLRISGGPSPVKLATSNSSNRFNSQKASFKSDIEKVDRELDLGMPYGQNQNGKPPLPPTTQSLQSLHSPQPQQFKMVQNDDRELQNVHFEPDEVRSNNSQTDNQMLQGELEYV